MSKYEITEEEFNKAMFEHKMRGGTVFERSLPELPNGKLRCFYDDKSKEYKLQMEVGPGLVKINK